MGLRAWTEAYIKQRGLVLNPANVPPLEQPPRLPVQAATDGAYIAYQWSIVQTGVGAGDSPSIRVRFPIGLGHGIIDSIDLSLSAAGSIDVGVINPAVGDLATVPGLAGSYTAKRFPFDDPSPLHKAIWTQAADAAATFIFFTIQLLGRTTYHHDFDPPLRMKAGDAGNVTAFNVRSPLLGANTLVLAMQWREPVTSL